MSFKSSIDTTYNELLKISSQVNGFEKQPTKYLLSLFKRCRKHLKCCGIDTFQLNLKYNQYLDDCYELNDTFEHDFSDFELKICELSHFKHLLKTILDKREHI